MTKITKMVDVISYKCDFCDCSSDDDYYIMTCELCGKHFCVDHGDWDYKKGYDVDLFCNTCINRIKFHK